jgi:hypothetical protein
MPIGGGVGGPRNFGSKGSADGDGAGGVGEDGVGEGGAGEGGVRGDGDIDGISELDGARISWFSKGKGAAFGAVCGDGSERDGEGGTQERGKNCSSSPSSSPRNSSTSPLRFAAFLVRFAGAEVLWDGSARDDPVSDADVCASAGTGSGGSGAGMLANDTLSLALAVGGSLLPPADPGPVAASMAVRVLTSDSLHSALAVGGGFLLRA